MSAKRVLVGWGAVLLCSCATDPPGDYREVLSARPAHPEVGEAAPGLVRVVSGAGAEHLFFCPSPDGAWGIFASDRHSANLRLYSADLRRAGVIHEIPGALEGNSIFPAFSADASTLAFSSDREGTWRVYVLELGAPAAPRPVTPAGAECLCPVWDPTRPRGEGRLAYCRLDDLEDRWEVCILELGSGQVAHLGPGLFPAWSPDGTYLAVQRPREGGDSRFDLWLLTVDGSEPPRELYRAARGAAANPCWSPDGRFLAFNAVGRKPGESLAGDGGGIYYLEVGRPGEPYGPLAGAADGSWRPSWSRDGKVYFHRRDGGSVSVYAVPGPPLRLEGGLAERR